MQMCNVTASLAKQMYVARGGSHQCVSFSVGAKCAKETASCKANGLSFRKQEKFTKFHPLIITTYRPFNRQKFLPCNCFGVRRKRPICENALVENALFFKCCREREVKCSLRH